MRTFALAVIIAAFAAPASAITPQQAKDEAHNWVVTRADIIQDRILECVTEGNPHVCHTGWAASVTANTDPADPALATQTLDDLGFYTEHVCGGCYTGNGTFAEAGIGIPATAPINFRINIHYNGQWGVELVIRVKYDGVEYERGYGKGIAEPFTWREVVDAIP